MLAIRWWWWWWLWRGPVSKHSTTVAAVAAANLLMNQDRLECKWQWKEGKATRANKRATTNRSTPTQDRGTRQHQQHQQHQHQHSSHT